MKFRIFNINICIEYSFFLMLSFGLLLGANDIFSLLLFSSLHELGHLVALKFFGGSAQSLTLSYYGLALKYNTRLTLLKEVIVLLAGPLINLVFYFILKDDINLLLFFINMLPVYPIDCGRIIRLFSYKLSKVLNIVFIIVLLILSIYLLVKNHSFSLLFITCYLIVYSINY